MNVLNTDTAETAKAEGIWLNGRYCNPSDLITCPRCGLARCARPSAAGRLCQDCKSVELWASREPADDFNYTPVRGPAGIVRFIQPMNAEDMAWCEKQAERGFWQRWERLNRGRRNPLQAQAEARIARHTTTKEGEVA